MIVMMILADDHDGDEADFPDDCDEGDRCTHQTKTIICDDRSRPAPSTVRATLPIKAIAVASNATTQKPIVQMWQVATKERCVVGKHRDNAKL